MFIPYKRNIQFKKKYQLKRAIPEGLKITIEKGSKVKPESVIASGRSFGKSVRIDIAEELGVKSQDVAKYIECLHGEQIEKDEVIARKTGKMMGKKVTIHSPSGGVVNLDFVSSGIIRILNPAEEDSVMAGVEGNVVSLISDKYAIVETDVLLVAGRQAFGKSVQGYLLYLEDQDASIEEHDLAGAIVVPDFRVDLDYLRDLAVAGVRAVILGGLDSGFRNELKGDGLWGMSVFITEGFGDIQINSVLDTILKENNEKLCHLDVNKSQFVLTHTAGRKKDYEKQPYFKEISIGDPVQILHSEYFHFYGIVDELEEDRAFIKIYRWGQERRIEVSTHNLISL